MKKLIYILFPAISFLFACSGSQKENSGQKLEHKHVMQEEKKVYTCPMHPEIIKDKPGQCPKCGMDLVEKMENGKNSTNEIELLLKPTNEYVIGDIKTISPKKMELPLEIDASGAINYDTREINSVSARVNGWVEKLYVKYQYQPVLSGQKLMDIYSKELVLEQENYIFLLNNDYENTSLIKSAEKRLLLLGLTEKQVDEIKNTMKSFKNITIYSPYSGHLHELSGIDPSNDKGMSMNENSQTFLTTKEGVSVTKGQNIFNIYGTNRVWAEVNIYNESIKYLKTGMPITLTINGETEEKINTVIDFIEPNLKETNTTLIRVYLKNTNDKLKIGTLVKAKIDAGKSVSSFIPSTSITYLGNSEVVFVKVGNIFKSRKVMTGVVSGSFIEIISGIDANETIAENAQMLMDSEGFIKTDTDYEMPMLP